MAVRPFRARTPLAGIVLACSVLPLLLGCAPNRSGDDDDSGPPGNSLSDALFTVIDGGGWQDTWQGRLVLVDSNVDCSELNWEGSLAWWNLSTEVQFVEVYLSLGVDLDGWNREFGTLYSWLQEERSDSNNAAFFTGQTGNGNSSAGDDDDDVPVEPPLRPGREVTAQFGDSAESENDSLIINTYNPEGLVTGFLQSVVGNYSFTATHCGVVEDIPIGGDGDDPVEPTPPG